MKLSDAILLGSALAPQVVGGDTSKGLCALSAASAASGIDFIDMDDGRLCCHYALLGAAYPILSQITRNPVTGVEEGMQRVIWDLNDRLKWSREAIAVWVAGIEAELDRRDPLVFEISELDAVELEEVCA